MKMVRQHSIGSQVPLGAAKQVSSEMMVGIACFDYLVYSSFKPFLLGVSSKLVHLTLRIALRAK